MNEQSGRITFEPNEKLLKEGERGDFAYLILSGKVNIVKGAMTNTPVTLAVVGKGEVVGEMSMFDDHAHMASVIAAEKTITTRISREQFQARLESMDPVMRGIMKLLGQRLRRTADDLTVEEVNVDWGNWRKSS
jgi:CRP/FNR family transcriptional regulator, cyclic AMP receptor protein